MGGWAWFDGLSEGVEWSGWVAVGHWESGERFEDRGGAIKRAVR